MSKPRQWLSSKALLQLDHELCEELEVENAKGWGVTGSRGKGEMSLDKRDHRRAETGASQPNILKTMATNKQDNRLLGEMKKQPQNERFWLMNQLWRAGGLFLPLPSHFLQKSRYGVMGLCFVSGLLHLT